MLLFVLVKGRSQDVEKEAVFRTDPVCFAFSNAAREITFQGERCPVTRTVPFTQWVRWR